MYSKRIQANKKENDAIDTLNPHSASKTSHFFPSYPYERQVQKFLDDAIAPILLEKIAENTKEGYVTWLIKVSLVIPVAYSPSFPPFFTRIGITVIVGSPAIRIMVPLISDAITVGYDSQSKFTSAFKDAYRVTPREIVKIIDKTIQRIFSQFFSCIKYQKL